MKGFNLVSRIFTLKMKDWSVRYICPEIGSCSSTWNKSSRDKDHKSKNLLARSNFVFFRNSFVFFGARKLVRILFAAVATATATAGQDCNRIEILTPEIFEACA